jgi:hypothetical protein
MLATAVPDQMRKIQVGDHTMTAADPIPRPPPRSLTKINNATRSAH